MSLKQQVVEYHRNGWPVSKIDELLGLKKGTARLIVVLDWRTEKENAEAAKLRRVYKHGGGSWLAGDSE